MLTIRYFVKHIFKEKKPTKIISSLNKIKFFYFRFVIIFQYFELF